MRPGVFPSVSPKRLLLWSAPLLWIGCGGGGGTDVVLPALTVTTSTGGVELDPDGYSVTIDGLSDQPIGANATLTVDRLSDGDHTVALSGLASNCAASGDNPRTVSVRSGSTTNVDFAVTCSATTGGIEVIVSTGGTGSDPDGFSILLDGADRGPVAAASAILPNIPPGSHTLGLTGLAGNCQVVGENPRSVAVTAGQTAQVPFTVTCSTPAPATGTLEVTTSTSGSDQDPDGYSIRVDGGTPQPISTNATLSLSNLSAEEHSVRLLGIASNCSLSGTNPVRVTVAAGGTAGVGFSVTCTAIGPSTGGIQVTVGTTGSSPDGDGYTLSLDGGAGEEIGPNDSHTFANVGAGSHSVRLDGVAGNCTVSGDNPRSVAVTAGQNASVSFAVACVTPPAGAGSVRITATTSGSSPDPDGYTVSVDGGTPLPLGVNGNRTVDNLEPRAHSVRLGGVAQNCTVAGDNPRSVSVVAGQTAAVTFSVSCASTAPSLNLRIERLYLSQSIQRLSGDVPLVAGRDAFLRVFVTANSSNSVRPSVRIRFIRGGATVNTLTIPANDGATPTAVNEGSLGSSWNVVVPGSLIQANTAVLAQVDPDNTVSETNESDNSFPVSGTAQPLSVQSVPGAAIRFVPILQSANGLQGVVGDPNQLVDLIRRMYPVTSVQTDVRSVFTISGPLQPENQNGEWNQMLTDLDGLRVAEGATDWTYYGLVRLDYSSGLIGNGLLSTPAAAGTDAQSEAQRVVTHELGHTWGQLHTPCFNPPFQDPEYPYPAGNIGVYGYDMVRRTLKLPSVPDIMGYCSNPWISDYTYESVMSFRRLHASSAVALAQPCLLVWGQIVNGRAVLQPAFQIVTRPSLPRSSGPYTVEASATNGTRLFTLSFDAAPTADDTRGSRHFAFAVPLDPTRSAQLSGLRLSGPGVPADAISPSAAAHQRPVVPDDIILQRDAGGVQLKWNASIHPMVMVRDPDTGEVLSFARGGSARVVTQKNAVRLIVSDGVRSQELRRAISR